MGVRFMKMILKHGLCFAWVLLLLSLVSCSAETSSSNLSPTPERDNPLLTVTLNEENIVTGQTVYVPIYSHVYHDNSQDHIMKLSATLSVRNTDSANPIILTSVRYYDTEGQLIRQDVDRPVALQPLASTSFFVATDDTRGGPGASFIVEWAAEQAVSEPVVEAVMISTSFQQGISFVSPGKVVKQLRGSQ